MIFLNVLAPQKIAKSGTIQFKKKIFQKNNLFNEFVDFVDSTPTPEVSPDVPPSNFGEQLYEYPRNLQETFEVNAAIPLSAALVNNGERGGEHDEKSA